MYYQELNKYGTYIGDYVRPEPEPRLMGADTLIGYYVYSNDDEKVGKIKEIMLNTYTGEVTYAVLSYGGLIGDGIKLFAVPWEALTLDTENKRFVINVDKSTLETAHGFDKDNWPDTADEIWVAEKINNSLWY